MFLRFRIGPREQRAPVRGPAVAVPNLLAVDDEMIAVDVGVGADIGEIGTGVRLGKSLAPDFFGAENFREIALLLCLGAKRDDSRTDQAKPQNVRQRRRTGLAHFLSKDDLLDQRGSAAAVFFRP